MWGCGGISPGFFCGIPVSGQNEVNHGTHCSVVHLILFPDQMPEKSTVKSFHGNAQNNRFGSKTGS